ncbi:putative ECF RNA polymerase sigma factor SigI [Streptomyces hundungensis]|uniref:Putative ECF RNA polymerase sigma factor SigI n=1 Tax=Streptomyces hundungensis TaxID=1077946 RepID=A0A387HGJ7_9ACTN|nr:sigma-70 family RNA polymerase sigma factor [Streptomyces hundungensis]AYG81393.1 putative ECF RNA polymerase sigma factor SigI [Streptomyces hundungensis]
MVDDEYLAQRFEEHRGHLRAVAYRMLGSLSEAEDAVQEGWLRASRADSGAVDNLGGWLTTIVARICLNMLRARGTRREAALDVGEYEYVHVPDPVLGPVDGADPEQEVLLADSVGLALMVVLETLAPAERLAFVLHDMFAVPFEDIAPIVDKTPAATRQLASRARRRVQGRVPSPSPDRARQREVVEAFISAARGGDFEALLALLDPDVVLRADAGALPTTKLVRGARAVAEQANSFRKLAAFNRLVLVNGAPGILAVVGGRVVSVLAFTLGEDARITELNILADPTRLHPLNPLGLTP